MHPIVSLIIYEDDLSRIVNCLNTLNRKARSRAVLLIDKSGQLIASAGKPTAQTRSRWEASQRAMLQPQERWPRSSGTRSSFLSSTRGSEAICIFRSSGAA